MREMLLRIYFLTAGFDFRLKEIRLVF